MALTALSDQSIPAQPFPPQDTVIARFVRGRDKMTRLTAAKQEPLIVAQAAECGADLPWQTPVTASDVRDLARLLRGRPAGLSVQEYPDAFCRRVLDPARLAVYRAWQIIGQTGTPIRLTPFGEELARGLAPETGLFRALLQQVAPYRAALQWLGEALLERVTDHEIIEYWRTQPGRQQTPGENVERIPRAKAVSFFHLCQAADFGTVTLGKRGQPSRLRVNQDELNSYLRRESPTHSRWTAPKTAAIRQAGKLRVAISTGSQTGLIQQIRTAFSLADMESEVIVREPGLPLSPGENAGENWRRCDAGLIIVSAMDHTDGALKESVLMSLGAASALYSNHFVLLWEKPVPIPAGLLKLRRCDFTGESLTWDLGAKLVQTLREFKT
ncbi:MAG: hypothetical protein ACKV2V_24925 [Blastocatellia bacterium]